MYPGKIAETTPDKPAVIMAGTGRTQTYAELDENSIRVARMLDDAGLRPGDVVALLSENNMRCFEIYWAALRSGLYITAINRHLSADEVAYIVKDSGARVLFASAGLRELAEVVAPMVPGLELRYAFDGPVTGFDSYEDALAAAPSDPLPNQPAGTSMLYSSGTTGRPKGVKGKLAPVQVGEPGADFLVPFVQHVFGIGADDVYLIPAPLYHAAPLRWAGAIHALGGTVVVMEKFDAEQTLALIERYQVTATQVVPTMFVRMLKLDDDVREKYDVSSLKVAIHAAAPCPVDVKRAMMDWWGEIIYEYYGATEGHGLTVVSPQDWLQKPGSVGKALLGTLHICDDDGAELPAGEIGLIYFERDEMPFEYHNDPEKTKRAQHPEHPTWTTVGDVGYVDDDGFLFLTDRKSFMIISGGVNIYPQEVEDVLTLHPKVLDVAVIGIPDPEMGEQVKAVVQPAPDVEPSPELADELIAYVRDRIAHYKAPRSVDFLDELPRTPTGKLLKGKLRERYAAAVAG
ncbi:fatty-acyl-CoA synthase [Haloechinothrix alba]|uniref:Fatty-acyl-CoA synthase n=1 Tax=Haloechinothrix alba TaxID=664784 RepID=A0A239AL56_9PSEU|nr:acyl-CoA synthetase [Haloechinothrix alba]SNR95663.1 fatty-acyl-CoA synthase [Haloechinothrix alba]